MVNECKHPVVDPAVEKILLGLGINIDYLMGIISRAPMDATHYGTDIDGDLVYYRLSNMGILAWCNGNWCITSRVITDITRSLTDAAAIVAMFKLQPSLQVKKFKMMSNVFRDSKPDLFTELNAPDWLTSVNTPTGSTMDHRYFWNERILKLDVGESFDTDFRRITRIG